MNVVAAADAKLRALSERLGALETRQTSPLRKSRCGNSNTVPTFLPTSPILPLNESKIVDPGTGMVSSSPAAPLSHPDTRLGDAHHYNEAVFSVMSRMQGRVDDVHNAVDQNITGLRSRVASAANRIDELTDSTSQKLIILSARVDNLESENKQLREALSDHQQQYQVYESKTTQQLCSLADTTAKINQTITDTIRDLSTLDLTVTTTNASLQSEIDSLKIKLDAFSSSLTEETRKTDSLSKMRVEEMEQLSSAKTDIIEGRNLHSTLAINFQEFSLELSKRVVALEDGLGALCRQQTRDRAVAVAAAVSSSTLTPQYAMR
eukprot:TRINITY_DN5837_c6_g1_i1.p1 TRINITY_DN5837_c6_g1~~TRINITY_DN5837_c6_g1_i1.p1  ORF type:complete len:332 (+),score=72.09 TRINITY_DN5837_c6_g1_i1:35-997(+)